MQPPPACIRGAIRGDKSANQRHLRTVQSILLNEFYRVAFRKKIYPSLDALQSDLDAFVESDNVQRPHHGRWCYGKTPMQTFVDSLALARDKPISNPDRQMES